MHARTHAVSVAWPAVMECPAPGPCRASTGKEDGFVSTSLPGTSPGRADPGRFARNETHPRPGSPALTLAGNTEHVVVPATYAPSRLGPGQADRFLPWVVPSPPRMSLHESARLGRAQRQPWAQDKFKGPSGGKCRVSVTNSKQRHRYRHRGDCYNYFLFWGCHVLRPPRPPQAVAVPFTV